MTSLGRETSHKVNSASENLKAASVLIPFIGGVLWGGKRIIDSVVEQHQLHELIDDPEGFKYTYGVTDKQYNELRKLYYDTFSENEDNSSRADRALKYALYKIHKKNKGQ